MCIRKRGACEWSVKYSGRRCWRVRLIRVLPTSLLDFPFSVALALLASVYGITALFGTDIGAIPFAPHPIDHLWGAVITAGAIIVWAALAKGRIGTWLPTGLWVCSVALLAYVASALWTLNAGNYLPRVTFSAIIGVVGVIQAFKLQTGHMWAVAAIRQAQEGGESG